MMNIVDSATLRSGTSGTVRFDGLDHGSQVSFFLVNNAPGEGPGLHVHPYPETWVVRSGEAEFTVGHQSVRAGAGAILIGPAGIPHKFVNLGPGRLELVCIHANDTIVQDFVPEPAVS
ncbi:MAG TPA: cupin domain-containing protein [Bosea sp. (in: a-proteobacteria)]|jgi:mannose-6-phosphate isomerase-like protein (cupin superfamily)|uniref:cupin domain-containing protein n=1 Tax=Bosea sp. (in: a-proteobacteria) TaxID=1871050 RepID=UPI002E0DBB0E|nr:cupin domain-containing protein [Bosea sp. (in: a-proteobacteria)]